MLYLDIKKEISELTTALIKVGICDDQNFPADHSLGNDIYEVTFSGEGDISSIFDFYEYETAYEEIVKNRAFNMKLIDGALIQLMYKVSKRGEIVKHRLAFYPSPKLLSFQSNSDPYMEDKLYIEIVNRKIVPFPLRFDFDVSAHIDIEHPKSHLTLGDSKNCRIPISHPMTPHWFIDFILRNFYQTKKYNFISELPKKRFSVPLSISDNERNIIHMVVPE
jgi:hypothetical protein